MIQKFKLTYNSVETELTINPDGWAENGQKWQRDRIYHGVFQTATVDTFRFSTKSGGGGDIIIEAYEADDIKAQVTVEVFNYNPQTGGDDVSYTGRLNYDPDQFKIDPYDRFVEVGFIQSGNIQNFLNRDDLEVDITSTESVDGVEMDDSTNPNIFIDLPSVSLYRIAETSGNYNDQFWFEQFSPANFGNPQGRFEVAGNEVQLKYYSNTIIVNELGEDLTAQNGPAALDRSPYIYTNNTPNTTVIRVDDFNTISGNIRIRLWDAGASQLPTLTLGLRIRAYDSDDNIIIQTIVETKSYTYYDQPGPVSPKVFYYTPDVSVISGAFFSIPSEGKFTVGIYANASGFDGGIYATQPMEVTSSWSTEVNITERTTSDDIENITCYKPIGVFKRIFQLITSNEDTFDSEVFGTNGDAENTVTTIGWNIRQFPNRALPVNLRDMFKSYSALYNLGCAYDRNNDRFYIEKIENFFDANSILFNLGEVKGLKISPYKDGYFNEYSGGNDNDGEYENILGVNEINVEASWSTDMPVKKMFKNRSPAFTDTVGIVLAARKEHELYASEDTDYDDRIYLIDTDGSDAIQGGNNLSGFKGIEEYYNIRFTPRENMIRHANWIKSLYWKNPGFVVRFRKSKKGVNITYENQNGDTVNEFDNMPSTEVTAVLRLFNPQYYEFEGTFDLEKAEAIKQNPHGLINFTYLGEPYSGFIDELQSKDYDRIANYKLIAYNAQNAAEMIWNDEEDINALFEDEQQILFD